VAQQDAIPPGTWGTHLSPFTQRAKCFSKGSRLIDKYEKNIEKMLADTFPDLPPLGKLVIPF